MTEQFELLRASCLSVLASRLSSGCVAVPYSAA